MFLFSTDDTEYTETHSCARVGLPDGGTNPSTLNFYFARRERRGRRECVASLALASGMKGSLFNTNCHEWTANFRKYFYFLTLISRKPQMTLITRIILSTEFKQITQNFASCSALAGLRDEGLFV